MSRLLCAVLALCGIEVLSAQTFTTVLSFDGANGNSPQAALIQGGDGNLYGTTGLGGTHKPPYRNAAPGTIFRITPSALETLHNFCLRGACAANGDIPTAGLVQAANGDLYGVTEQGGAYPGYYGHGGGTAFKLSDSGGLTTLYNFCAQAGCADGEFPEAALIFAGDGNFYGTTYGGGNERDCVGGCGTVFKIAPSGVLTTLHVFSVKDGNGYGSSPSGLVQGADGNFYGTTPDGGVNLSGSVFKITPSGTLSTIYSFCVNDYPYCTDGAVPLAGLIEGTDGNLYGAARAGGLNGGPNSAGGGTVFRITPAGAFTTLYEFCSQANCADGSAPETALIEASDESFYGTTIQGGTYGRGTIFRITPAGALTVLYSFCAQSNCADGMDPRAALLQASNGDLYGTTSSGGAYCPQNLYPGCGTVFRLSLGLVPPVNTRPSLIF